MRPSYFFGSIRTHTLGESGCFREGGWWEGRWGLCFLHSHTDCLSFGVSGLSGASQGSSAVLSRADRQGKWGGAETGQAREETQSGLCECSAEGPQASTQEKGSSLGQCGSSAYQQHEVSSHRMEAENFLPHCTSLPEPATSIFWLVTRRI